MEVVSTKGAYVMLVPMNTRKVKHLHDRIIFGPFDFFHEVTIWRGPISVISFILTKNIFVYLYFHGDRFNN